MAETHDHGGGITVEVMPLNNGWQRLAVDTWDRSTALLVCQQYGKVERCSGLDGSGRWVVVVSPKPE